MTGYGEVPMEGEFLSQPDDPSKLRSVLDGFWVDKGEPVDKAPSSDASNPNRSIPKAFPSEKTMYDPYCNYLGFESGNTTIVQMDEFKVLNNTVNAVPVVFAEDCQTIDGQNGSERI